MSTQPVEEQRALTDGVAGYYASRGPSGIGDRNTHMALPPALSAEDLELENIPLLAPEAARQILIHHHFGLGIQEQDPRELGQEDITRALYGLEENQVSILLNHMGPIQNTDEVLDLGSGRGGTAFTLHDRFGCSVHGITIAPYQAKFSSKLAGAAQRENTHFTVMNMLHLGFPGESFDHAIQNETDMYILNLKDLYGEIFRVLKPGGRFTLGTWCRSGEYFDSHMSAKPIDDHYKSKMHGSDEYRFALEQTGFADIDVIDYTQRAIPYWNLRDRWQERSGVEKYYLDGYESGRLKYLVASAQKPLG